MADDVVGQEYTGRITLAERVAVLEARMDKAEEERRDLKETCSLILKKLDEMDRSIAPLITAAAAATALQAREAAFTLDTRVAALGAMSIATLTFLAQLASHVFTVNHWLGF